MSSLEKFRKLMRAHVVVHQASTKPREEAIQIHAEGVAKYQHLLPDNAVVTLESRRVWDAMSYLDKLKWGITHIGAWKKAATEMRDEIERFNQESAAYIKVHEIRHQEYPLPVLMPPLWLEPRPFKVLSFEMTVMLPKEE